MGKNGIKNAEKGVPLERIKPRQIFGLVGAVFLFDKGELPNCFFHLHIRQNIISMLSVYVHGSFVVGLNLQAQ